MKEYLAELVQQAPTPAQGGNLAREYLQARFASLVSRYDHLRLQQREAEMLFQSLLERVFEQPPS